MWVIKEKVKTLTTEEKKGNGGKERLLDREKVSAN